GADPKSIHRSVRRSPGRGAAAAGHAQAGADGVMDAASRRALVFHSRSFARAGAHAQAGRRSGRHGGRRHGAARPAGPGAGARANWRPACTGEGGMNMSVAHVYRDVEVGLHARLDAGIRARANEVQTAHPALADIYARRMGRIAGGVVGVCLGCALPLAAGLMSATNSNFDRGQLTIGLIAAVCVSVATSLAARAWAREHAHRLLATFKLSGNVHADIARLESEHPVAALAARAERLERASIGWSLAAIALLAPLSIHLVVAGFWARGHFDRWMLISYIIVGHAHLFLVICAIRLA